MEKDMVPCPYCGELIRPDALACPHCGSDEKTGWSENAENVGLIPDHLIDDADEDTYRSMGLDDGKGFSGKPVVTIVVIIIILLVIALWQIMV